MFSQNSNPNTTVSEVVSLDPLVGDTSCQNRAVYLVDIARRIQIGEKLSSEDNVVIETSRLLTQTKQLDRSPCGYIQRECTDITTIPEIYCREKKLESNRSRNKFISENKSKLAKQCFTFLSTNCKMRYFGEFKFYEVETNLAVIKLDNFSIPILPMYISAKMMMRYVMERNIPFVVNFKRVISNLNEDEICDGAATLIFRSNFGKELTLIEPAFEQEEPVIIADIYCFKGSKYEAKSSFLNDVDFNACLEKFTALGPLKIMMLAGASHPQYTKQTRVNTNDPMSNIANPEESDQQVDISLTDCSPAEFTALRRLAAGFGFFEKRIMVDHVYTGLASEFAKINMEKK